MGGQAGLQLEIPHPTPFEGFRGSDRINALNHVPPFAVLFGWGGQAVLQLEIHHLTPFVGFRGLDRLGIGNASRDPFADFRTVLPLEMHLPTPFEG